MSYSEGAVHELERGSRKNLSSGFQNEDIFVQLDELDELDKITHAWIGFNYSLTQAQKAFLCNG